MAYLALALLILGAVFLLAEAFIPGFGVFGISGIVLIVISSVITIIAVKNGPYIVIGEVVILSVATYMLLQYMKKHHMYGKIILDETLGYEEKEIGNMEYFLGKEGLTITPLKPFGTAEFNGISMEVYSEGKYIEANTPVKVIEVTQQKIIVRQTESRHN